MRVDPAIEPAERFDGRRDVDLHAQVPQAAEAGGDVKRDVFVAAARRGTTATRRPDLHLRQFLAAAGRSRR